MTKRDDDSGAHATGASDIEVNMTTAERRRRRRRGGGLRVPSDNVPRRTSQPPPVVAPVPEDPSLAMSIAYSFSSEASEPVPRITVETPGPRFDDGPVAPDAVPTVIDPPSLPVETQDFEMKTREMAAVDLEALGLVAPAAASSFTGEASPVADLGATDPDMKVPRDTPREGVALSPTVEVDRSTGGEHPGDRTTIGVPLASEPPTKPPAVGLTPAPTPAPVDDKPRDRKERLKTMALSEDDLEDVREAVRAASAASQSQPLPVQAQGQPHQVQGQPAQAPQTQGHGPSAADEMWGDSAPREPPPLPPPTPPTPPTPVVQRSEPMSVPEIDIRELSEKSGEYEVDMEVDDKPAVIAAPEPLRPRAPSVPPPIAPHAAAMHPGAAMHGHASPPPPPPAATHHKAPPTPPPAAKKVEKPTAAAKEPRGARTKAWFAELFDEDYLRTLPFLTPQATQSEAEFVIDAMSLSPGAQVLDVGCGYGRHAMELAARGFHVVGLDLSTPLLVRGGEEAHRRGLEINFIRGDMRELDFENQFDAAYCLFSTFGYFDDETNKRTIGNIARALKPGGRVMIEILNRDYVIADLPTRVWWEGEGCVVLEEVELNYFSSRIQVNRSVVFDDGRQLEQEISVRAYSLHEVGKLMHAAGFRVLEVSGGYQTRGRFFGNQSRHIIVVAERKDAAPT